MTPRGSRPSSWGTLGESRVDHFVTWDHDPPVGLPLVNVGLDEQRKVGVMTPMGSRPTSWGTPCESRVDHFISFFFVYGLCGSGADAALCAHGVGGRDGGRRRRAVGPRRRRRARAPPRPRRRPQRHAAAEPHHHA